MQRFVDKASWIPPSATKISELQGLSFSEIAELNKKGLPFGVLGEITLRDGWLAAVKGIFAEHFRGSDRGSPFAGRKLRYPNHLEPGSSHAPPPVEITNGVFRLVCLPATSAKVTHHARI